MAGKMLDRYGRATIARVVAAFYADVLQSPQLGHYFTDLPMGTLVEHQSLFMAAVMGGPEAFDADHIEKVHRPLGITGDDYEEMLRLLEERLRQRGIEPDDITGIIDGYRMFEAEVIHPDEPSR